MRAQTIQLQNEDGSHRQWLSEGEIERMIERKQIERVSRRKEPVQRYRMNGLPEASESRMSAASLTQSDLRVLVGIQKATERKVERLIGFGLLPKHATVPAYGYF